MLFQVLLSQSVIVVQASVVPAAIAPHIFLNFGASVLQFAQIYIAAMAISATTASRGFAIAARPIHSRAVPTPFNAMPI
ncbi:hypothetical protein SRABI106_04209 [Rahnella aquatilis]|nr:hypothetical protein SRABI106_04209 [Rahnella aquatilis]